jgi:energy-converting hydrogenase Eha subunit A
MPKKWIAGTVYDPGKPKRLSKELPALFPVPVVATLLPPMVSEISGSKDWM